MTDHICLRCGKRMDEPGSEVTLHGERGMQHNDCATHYRGTDVHYRKRPGYTIAQEVYSHDWGDGVVFAFNVTSLRWRALKDKRPTIESVVQHDQIPGMMRAREMTPENAMAVYQRRITQGTWDEPGILVYHPEKGGSLIIDGNHRYVARSMLGYQTMRFHLFQLADMGRDMLRGVDKEMMQKHVVTDARWGL